MFNKAYLTIGAVLGLAFVSNAQVPQLINYQGILTDANGNQLTDTLTIEFKIYDADDPAATAMWSEMHRDVIINNGAFSVLLGSGSPIPFAVFSGGDRYLGIAVDGDPEMTPRKRLVSVGYSFHAHEADKLNGKDATNFLQQLDGVSGGSNGNIDFVAGSNMTITPDDGNNRITFSSTGGGDNLGNHQATQNIKLNGHWLSNDGGNEGVKVSNSGNVETSADVVVGDDLTTNGYLWAVTNVTAANGHMKTGNTTPSFVGDGDIYAKQDLIAGSGYIRTGTPSHAYGNGDVASTEDVVADRTVYGHGSGGSYGVYGQGGNVGVYGRGGTYGVYGKVGTKYGYLGSSSYGGYAHNGNGNYVVLAGDNALFANGNVNHAGYFQGKVYIQTNLRVDGIFSARDKRFMIDHPIKPSEKYFYHYCIESNERFNLYSGTTTLEANGETTVELPEWFEVLNKDFRYQLTCIGGFAPVYIAEEIKNNQFKIAGGKPGMKISWQITGIRNDAYAKAHPVQIEEDKIGDDIGKYLNPIEHGMPESMGIGYDYVQRMEEEQMRMEAEHHQMLDERIIIEQMHQMHQIDSKKQK